MNRDEALTLARADPARQARVCRGLEYVLTNPRSWPPDQPFWCEFIEPFKAHPITVTWATVGGRETRSTTLRDRNYQVALRVEFDNHEEIRRFLADLQA